MLHRDALRDHPAAITTDSAATHVADDYKSTCNYLPPSPSPVPAHSEPNQRFAIDPTFVAHTVYKVAQFDGDSFARSFRMDAPLMPQTGDFEFGSVTFCPFRRLKLRH
jgi:hypothetical protein